MPLSTQQYADKENKSQNIQQQQSHQYGCSHYKTGCQVKCEQCYEFFTCRFCHNEEKNEGERDAKKQHEINRFNVKQVKCLQCNNIQKPSAKCDNCGLSFGNYVCLQCNLFDYDTTKQQYHCDECGVCRQGGKENFFHCNACGACMSILIKNKHKCMENAIKQKCPICQQEQFHSTEQSLYLQCGHTLHRSCFKELSKHKYQCPLCFKSFCDMWVHDRQLDNEIENTPMPEEFRDRRVKILCNDCSERSEVNFHVLGAKCQNCHSYNTRVL